MILAVKVLAVVGFVVSMYALSVELKARKNKSYRAVCDINESMSCTKAFTSSYGKLLFLPNSAYGLIFYCIMFVLAVLNQPHWMLYLAMLSFAGSLYLAYLSYVKMKNFCLVCTTIYLINALLLLFSA